MTIIATKKKKSIFHSEANNIQLISGIINIGNQHKGFLQSVKRIMVLKFQLEITIIRYYFHMIKVFTWHVIDRRNPKGKGHLQLIIIWGHILNMFPQQHLETKKGQHGAQANQIQRRHKTKNLNTQTQKWKSYKQTNWSYNGQKRWYSSRKFSETWCLHLCGWFSLLRVYTFFF